MKTSVTKQLMKATILTQSQCLPREKHSQFSFALL